VIVDGVTITSETSTWVELRIDKGCLVVLTRKEFIAGLKRGKARRRAAAMKARLAGPDHGDGGVSLKGAGDDFRRDR
jgi:hypothetical protein